MFSTPLLETTATNAANYVVTNLLGGTLAVTNVQFLNATNILLTTSAPRLYGNNYLVAALNLQDTSTNIISSSNNVAPVSILLTLLDERSFWYFENPDSNYGDEPDLGISWRQPDYEPYQITNANVFWADNRFIPGAFWYGTTNIPAALGFQLSQSGFPIIYFRTKILFPGSPLGSSVSLTHLIKDGARFFLDGQEVSRFNMPAGPVAWDTFASSAASIAWRGLEGFSKLKPGTNTICVELHTAQTYSSSVVFALRLQARINSFAGGPVVITRQPSSQTCQEGQDVTFAFQSAGAERLQWYKNGTAIVGATNKILTLQTVSNALDGSLYSVAAWNSTSTNRSTSAKLTVLADTNPPSLLAAYITGSNCLQATFSEPLDPTTATNAANYSITNQSWGGIVITSAVLTNQTNVLLQVSPGQGNGYILTARNIRDLHHNTSSFSWTTIGLSLSFPVDSTWAYNSSGLDLGNAWKQPGFDDRSWPIGRGLFYNEGAPLPAPKNTPLSLTADGSYIRTFYFRKHFTIPFGVISTASFRHVIDDGVVFYSNGSEVHRFNMPPGAVNSTTSANVSVENAEFQGPYSAFAPLIPGNNVIAAEVHQAGLTSGDICFGAEVSFTAPSGHAIVVSDCFNRLCSSMQNNLLILSWDIGTLQKASFLQGTNTVWQNVTNAINPYTVYPSNTAAFFRVKFPPNGY